MSNSVSVCLSLSVQVIKSVNASYVALHDSRGTEDADHKVLMRVSVLFADALLFLPSAIAFSRAASDGDGQR